MVYILSASKLNVFASCPHCFWLAEKQKIKAPAIFPTLLNGIDNVIKQYMNRYRPELPPIFDGKIEGKLISNLPAELETEIDGNILKGRLDECIVNNGKYIALDHKSIGFENKAETLYDAYQNQMDVYTLLLKENGYPVVNKAYLVYYYPSFGELHNGFPFKIIVKKIHTNPFRALRLFKKAVECLNGSMPPPSDNCNVCNFVKDYNRFK